MAYAPYSGPVADGNYQPYGVKKKQEVAPAAPFNPFRGVGSGVASQPGELFQSSPTGQVAGTPQAPGIPSVTNTLGPAVNNILPVAQNGLASPTFTIGGAPTQTVPQPTGVQAPIAPGAPQLGAPAWWKQGATQINPLDQTWTADGSPSANGMFGVNNYNSMLQQFIGDKWQGGAPDDSSQGYFKAQDVQDWLAQTGNKLMSNQGVGLGGGADTYQNMHWIEDAQGNFVGDPSFNRDDPNGVLKMAVLAAMGYFGGGALAGAEGAGAGAGAVGGDAAFEAAATDALAGSGNVYAGAGASGAGTGSLAPLAAVDTTGVTVGPTMTNSALGTTGASPGAMPAVSGGWNWGKVGDAASKVGDAILDNPFRSVGTALALNQAFGNGGGSGAPNFNAPDAINQQTQSNQDTALFNAYLNRPDQVTPYGSSTWTLKPGADPKNPKPGDWIQTTSLSPNQQQLLQSDEQLKLGLNSSAQSALGRVNSTLGAPLDLSGAPALGQVSNFTGADRQRIEDALMARLAPGFAQDEEAMRSRVLNTGFELGSEGAMREQARLDRAKNDARLAAIAQSGQEAERLGNISRANALFQNQSRQQAIQEILAQRALPLNELNAIRNGTQVTMPQFSPVNTSNASTTNVLDALLAQFKGQQTNAANQQAGYNNLLSQLAMLWGQD